MESIKPVLPTEGARSRSATPPCPAGQGFRVPPAKRAGALLVGAKTQKAGCFRNRPFMFWCPRRELGHVPRPRLALQGKAFESLPQSAQALCSWAPKRKRPVACATDLLCFGAHGGSSVTFRDPALPCRARLSSPSRKARRRFARGRQNAKGRLLAQPTFYVLVPTEGLEPPHLAAHGPEPCASTNSATWATLVAVCCCS